eukprot:4681582-Pleurochrysis_carterae.AAC.1
MEPSVCARGERAAEHARKGRERAWPRERATRTADAVAEAALLLRGHRLERATPAHGRRAAPHRRRERVSSICKNNGVLLVLGHGAWRAHSRVRARART